MNAKRKEREKCEMVFYREWKCVRKRESSSEQCKRREKTERKDGKRTTPGKCAYYKEKSEKVEMKMKKEKCLSARMHACEWKKQTVWFNEHVQEERMTKLSPCLASRNMNKTRKNKETWWWLLFGRVNKTPRSSEQKHPIEMKRNDERCFSSSCAQRQECSYRKKCIMNAETAETFLRVQTVYIVGEEEKTMKISSVLRKFVRFLTESDI